VNNNFFQESQASSVWLRINTYSLILILYAVCVSALISATLAGTPPSDTVIKFIVGAIIWSYLASRQEPQEAPPLIPVKAATV